MDQQQPSSDDLAANWEAAIVYPDARAPTVLTPPDGVPHAEAQAIAATYAETATVEGGEITTASLRGYPEAKVVASFLREFETDMTRRTGRRFTLSFVCGVLRCVRDDGCHTACCIRPMREGRTFKREPERSYFELVPDPERCLCVFEYWVDEAIDAIVRGHKAEAA